MHVDPRLSRLRALVERLHRLPASTRRDWVIVEARARMADVETGDPPRAIRPEPVELDARPASSERAAPPSPVQIRPVPEPHRKVSRKRAAPRPRPAPVPPPGARPLPGPEEDRPHEATADDGVHLSGPGSDGLLSLEDLPSPAHLGENDVPAWRRGLRG